MKIMKRIFILMLLLTGSSVLTAVAGNSEKTENRDVHGFNAVKVSTGINLHIRMGDTESVKVVADDDIIDNIKTEVKDGTLHVFKKTGWFNWNVRGSQEVYVTARQLERLEASSGSDVRSENMLKGYELKISASSGSDVSIEVYYKNVWLSTSSGSNARLSGKAKTFNAEASSGSDINATELEAAICKVNVSSGSDAKISVTDELYATASSGGDVRYKGNPAVKKINQSSGGEVRQR